MSRTQRIQDTLTFLLTMQDLSRLFRVTPMTIHLWRLNRGLPAVVIPGDSRPAVRFDYTDVLKWAAANNLPIFPMLRRADASIAACGEQMAVA